MTQVNLDFKRMKEICLAELPYFATLGTQQDTIHGPLFHIDNGATILGVAHLDSVQSTKHFYRLLVGKDERVFNAQLDDRLGAYVILDLLPKMGFKYDILLTWGEETGNSTAQFFRPNKKYRWMFQFDRRGSDVVRYQYDSENLKKKLNRAGFNRVEHGAFSDIAYLGHLGCEGFNVGVGYDNEHSEWASADMHVLREQVARFKVFWNKFSNHEFPHIEKPKVIAPSWGGQAGGYGSSYRYLSNQARVHTHTYSVDENLHMGTGIVHLPTMEGRESGKAWWEIMEEEKEKIKTGGKTEVVPFIAVSGNCSACGRALIQDIDKDSLVDGVCVMCMDKFEICVGCGKKIMEGEGTDAEFCRRCVERMETTNYPTKVRCAHCRCKAPWVDYVINECSNCGGKIVDDTLNVIAPGF